MSNSDEAVSEQAFDDRFLVGHELQRAVDPDRDVADQGGAGP